MYRTVLDSSSILVLYYTVGGGKDRELCGEMALPASQSIDRWAQTVKQLCEQAEEEFKSVYEVSGISRDSRGRLRGHVKRGDCGMLCSRV